MRPYCSAESVNDRLLCVTPDRWRGRESGGASRIGWDHVRVVPLRGPGPAAAGRQVPGPRGAPHARGVAVPAHRAGDRRGWPAAGARRPVRGHGRLAAAGRVGRSWPAAWRRRGGSPTWNGGGSPRCAPWPRGAGARASGRGRGEAAASDPGLWLDVAHAVVVLPVALVTSVVTALWWFLGLATATFPPAQPGHLRVAAAHDPEPGQRPVPHRREPGAEVAGRASRLRRPRSACCCCSPCRW